MIRHVRGFKFRYAVKSENSQLVIINSENKYILDTIEVVEGIPYIVENADVTSEWVSGNYNYQILDENGIVEEGNFIVLKNFALEDQTSFQSYWKTVLDAIDATLAGKATSAQQSVTVGDKSINYMSLSELLKLREFAKNKVAEEEAADKGETPYDKNNQHIIKFVWR